VRAVNHLGEWDEARPAVTSVARTLARVTPARSALLALLVGAVCVGVSACGGSDETSGGESTTTTTTSAAGGNERLSSADWAMYQTALADAQAVNADAVKAFTRCRNLVGTNADADKVKTCLGDATTAVVAEGQKFLSVLEGFDVTGACGDARSELVNYVRAYVSSVNGITRSLEAGSTASLGANVTNATHGLTEARKAEPKFTAACKPL
jgi:hypothetical protein